MPHYNPPPFLVSHIANPLLSLLVKMGMSPRGAQILSVRGRKSGQWRSTPVNPMSLDGSEYLVAPRGDTQWARNLRASGEGRLRLGRKTRSIRVTEVPEAERAPILREYLRRWYSDVGEQFGVEKDAGDADLARIAPEHPVFRIKANQ